VTLLPSNDYVRVRRSPIAGTGVFAARDIPARTKIGDVTRPLVRYSKVPQEGDPGYGHAIQIRKGWWLLLDGTPFYFLNHRCGSNTRLRIRGRRLTIETDTRVGKGVELTLDYATVAFRDDPYHFNCRCGSPECRGVVRGERRPRRPRPRPRRRQSARGTTRSAPRSR
jgi:hypothetical protein